MAKRGGGGASVRRPGRGRDRLRAGSVSTASFSSTDPSDYSSLSKGDEAPAYMSKRSSKQASMTSSRSSTFDVAALRDPSRASLRPPARAFVRAASLVMRLRSTVHDSTGPGSNLGSRDGGQELDVDIDSANSDSASDGAARPSSDSSTGDDDEGGDGSEHESTSCATPKLLGTCAPVVDSGEGLEGEDAEAFARARFGACVNTLEVGESFGELALLSPDNTRRLATVLAAASATSGGELLVISKATYDHTVKVAQSLVVDAQVTSFSLTLSRRSSLPPFGGRMARTPRCRRTTTPVVKVAQSLVVGAQARGRPLSL